MKLEILSFITVSFIKIESGNEQIYTGMTSNMLKSRFGSHKESITKKINATTALYV